MVALVNRRNKNIKPPTKRGIHSTNVEGTILVEPIYRQQPQENEKEYKLFLIYRDLPWMDRSLRVATAIALGVHINTVEVPHSAVTQASAKWQWPLRCNTYDLFIQEYSSEREEKVRLQMKSKIERICYNLVSKIERIEKIEKAEDLAEAEIQRDMAVVQAMIGKDNSPSKFMLEAYKTIVGQRIVTSSARPLPALDWKA